MKSGNPSGNIPEKFRKYEEKWLQSKASCLLPMHTNKTLTFSILFNNLPENLPSKTGLKEYRNDSIESNSYTGVSEIILMSYKPDDGGFANGE